MPWHRNGQKHKDSRVLYDGLMRVCVIFQGFLGTIIWVIVGAILAVLLITFLKWRFWEARVRRARRRAQQERMGPDGKPYPPDSRGLCDGCQKAAEIVFYPPEGGKLCKPCYDAKRKDSEEPHDSAASA